MILRLMGLDLGERRIGVALSDPEQSLAGGLTVLHRTTLDRDLAAIGDLIKRHEVRAVVLGLPRRLDGSLGPQAFRTLAFGDELRRRLGIVVIPWDERLTTVEAEQAMIEAGVSRKKRKGKLDQVAAALILQSYLDHLADLRRAEERHRPPGDVHEEAST